MGCSRGPALAFGMQITLRCHPRGTCVHRDCRANKSPILSPRTSDGVVHAMLRLCVLSMNGVADDLGREMSVLRLLHMLSS
jgi:hypothetical protein